MPTKVGAFRRVPPRSAAFRRVPPRSAIQIFVMIVLNSYKN
jgi:hypothetical protein